MTQALRRSARRSFVTAALALTVLLLPVPAVHADGHDPSSAARQQLIELIEKVPGGDGQPAPEGSGFRYGARDVDGGRMDAIKVIPAKQSPHRYLGTYHQPTPLGSFVVRYARSDDLLTWKPGAIVPEASQATLARRPDGSLLAAYEQRFVDGRSQLAFAHYLDDLTLLAGVPLGLFSPLRELSTWNEGTPSLEDVTNFGAAVRFHYLDTNADDPDTWADRNARGTLSGFPGALPRWSDVRADNDINDAVKRLVPDVHHIGDRDGIDLGGHRFQVVEAQTEKNDQDSWRLFLYDETAESLTPLDVDTHGDSVSFGNPTVTRVKHPNRPGEEALVVTLFLFAEGVRGTDPAGQLIYYRTLD